MLKINKKIKLRDVYMYGLSRTRRVDQKNKVLVQIHILEGLVRAGVVTGAGWKRN